MSIPGFYSLASPTDKLIDDNSLIEKIFNHIDNKTTDLGDIVWQEPVSNYLDPDRFKKEIDLIRSSPVPFCPSIALPSSGSFIARTAALTPLLVTRDQDNKIRAFVNACRHRGMQVAKGSGCKKAFICPYHGWTYGLDGSNKSIPDQYGFPGIDKNDYGLHEINAFEKGGIVYVIQNGEISDQMIDDQLDFFTHDQKLFNTSEITDDANWKLLTETLLEGYHIKSLHRNSFYPYGLDNLNVVENYGNNSRVIFPFKRIDKLRNQKPEDRIIDGCVTSVYSLFPNASISVLSKHTNLVILEPISPTQSKWIIYSLVNRGNSKNVITEDDAKKDAEFVGSTGQDEDREAARAIQETLHTKANDHLTFGYFEKAIINFHQAIKKGISNS